MFKIKNKPRKFIKKGCHSHYGCIHINTCEYIGISMNKKKMLSLLLVTLLLIGAIATTACSKKTTTNDPSTSLVLTINDTKIYLNEMMYYIYPVEAEGDYNEQMSQEYFGISYWDMEYSEGVTMREQTKEFIIETAIMYEVLYNEAVKEGYTLTEEELAESAENAKAIMKDLPKEQLAITGFTEEILKKVQEKLLLGDKYHAKIMEGISIDEDAIAASIKYEDYKQYDTEYLYVPTIDEEDLSIEEARTILNEALEEIKGGADFEDIENPDIMYSELSFVYGDGTIDSNFQDAAIPLSINEITDTVIEAEDGLYIIKMMSNDSRESHEAAIEEAIFMEEDEKFMEVFDELLKSYTTEVNKPIWDTIIMGKTTILPQK